MLTKKCKHCERELPLSEYRKRPGCKDGLNTVCKDCTREQNRQLKLRKKKEQEEAGTFRRRDCFAFKKVKNKDTCVALKVRICEGCSFYKPKEALQNDTLQRL